MPDDESVFDSFCRVLGSGMSRRSALKLFAGTMITTGLNSMWPGRASAQAAPANPATPVGSVALTGVTVSDVIDFLRNERTVAVSFVEGGSAIPVTIATDNATVGAVLDQIVAQDPSYRWTVEQGHLVLLPVAPEFVASVTGVNVTGTSRLDAANRYLQQLRVTIPAFASLYGVAVKGDTRSPVYTATVSLAPQATVLTHLTQLLGDDPAAVFTTSQILAGGSVMTFAAVQAPPRQGFAAATCRAISLTYANQKKVTCAAGSCGAGATFDITKVVTCPGDDCSGKKVTEKVTTDEGCSKGAVNTGPGCDIGAGNAIANCTDLYRLCQPTATVPAGGCTEKYTQELFVDGVLTDTCTLTFTLTPGKPCTGTFARTCTSGHKLNQCCTLKDGSMVFCDTGQLCCNGACCTAKDPVGATSRCVTGVGCCVPPTLTGPTANGARSIKVKVTDPKGLQSVTTTCDNCTATTSAAAGCSPAVKSIVVTATKPNDKPAHLTVVATNCEGCTITGDPVITTLRVGRRGRVTQTFGAIAATERYISIANGNPGLQLLRIEVNDSTFSVTALEDDATRTIDIGAAMLRTDNNTVKLVAFGRPGSSAVVVLSDSAATAAAGSSRGQDLVWGNLIG